MREKCRQQPTRQDRPGCWSQRLYCVQTASRAGLSGSRSLSGGSNHGQRRNAAHLLYAVPTHLNLRRACHWRNVQTRRTTMSFETRIAWANVPRLRAQCSTRSTGSSHSDLHRVLPPEMCVFPDLRAETPASHRMQRYPELPERASLCPMTQTN